MIDYRPEDVIRVRVRDEHGKSCEAKAVVLETMGNELLVVQAEGFRFRHLIDRSAIIPT